MPIFRYLPQKTMFSKTDFTFNLHFSRRFFWGIKHENLFFHISFTKGSSLWFFRTLKRKLEKSREFAEKRQTVLSSGPNCLSFAPVAVIFKIHGQILYALMYTCTLHIHRRLDFGISAGINSTHYKQHGEGSRNSKRDFY